MDSFSCKVRPPVSYVSIFIRTVQVFSRSSGFIDLIPFPSLSSTLRNDEVSPSLVSPDGPCNIPETESVSHSTFGGRPKLVSLLY